MYPTIFSPYTGLQHDARDDNISVEPAIIIPSFLLFVFLIKFGTLFCGSLTSSFPNTEDGNISWLLH